IRGSGERETQCYKYITPPGFRFKFCNSNIILNSIDKSFILDIDGVDKLLSKIKYKSVVILFFTP
ncbi:MAG TPA: hypothetical protein PK447_03765, partial [Ignavibacteria bacterium]|nr:hypothetical protein [Ignavibacteria bacterium]